MVPKGKPRKERGKKRTAKCPNIVPEYVTIGVNNKILISPSLMPKKKWYEKYMIVIS